MKYINPGETVIQQKNIKIFTNESNSIKKLLIDMDFFLSK